MKIDVMFFILKSSCHVTTSPASPCNLPFVTTVRQSFPYLGFTVLHLLTFLTSPVSYHPGLRVCRSDVVSLHFLTSSTTLAAGVGEGQGPEPPYGGLRPAYGV